MVRRVEPWLVGLSLLLLSILLLIIEQWYFGYKSHELVEKMILALANYGLALIALAYGLRI